MIKKFQLFPLHYRSNKLRRKIPFATLVHLFFRWFSCPFEKLLPLLPGQGVVLDLGCGHGIMLQMADGLLSQDVKLIGFDIDVHKIDLAQVLNVSQRVSYKVCDITADAGIRDVSSVVLNDVLHLFVWSDQEELLRRCYHYLSPNGVLLIKEIEAHFSWKYYWTYFQELLVNHVFRLTYGRGLCYRTKDSLLEVLGKCGFQIDVIPAHKGYPYAHIIYCCHKN